MTLRDLKLWSVGAITAGLFGATAGVFDAPALQVLWTCLGVSLGVMQGVQASTLYHKAEAKAEAELRKENFGVVVIHSPQVYVYPEEDEYGLDPRVVRDDEMIHYLLRRKHAAGPN